MKKLSTQSDFILKDVICRYEVAQAEARKYASEIIPAFNAYIYFRIGYWLAKKMARLVYRVRVGFYDNDKISEAGSNSSVVFVMNHRSNMDYVLVSFLVAEKTRYRMLWESGQGFGRYRP